MWFGALYGVNPLGSKAFGGNPTTQQRLQQLAWETLTKEPLSGVGKIPQGGSASPDSQVPGGAFGKASTPKGAKGLGPKGPGPKAGSKSPIPGLDGGPKAVGGYY